MKRIIFLLVLILSFTLVMSQELTVKNFALAPQDLTASTQRRDDNNGQACALIKVQLARPGAEFLGNVMGGTPYNKSEYFVYMMKGSKMLQVKLEGYLPVMIDFEKDWGIAGVEPLTTYVLSITLPTVPGQMDDDGKTYFSLSVSPKNANVYVDGEPRSLDEDGTIILRLARGGHRYRIDASGYESKEESFTLGMERKSVRVSLISTKATLTVKCSTTGADIYINEKKYGSNSLWTGNLESGSYIIEARKDGYYSQRQSIDLGAKQSCTVELPALIARVGQLDVTYKPQDAEVWIDGKKVGLSPDLYKNLVVGTHRVEIRKNGYQGETKLVTIVEGQTVSLSGSLSTLTIPLIAIHSSINAPSPTTTSPSSSLSSSKHSFTVNGASFTMVRVDGGTFSMGATTDTDSEAYDNEKPVHQVTLSSFSIGETEVTQELWEAVMGRNPSYFKGAKRPVEQVNWDDCQEFIAKLNEKTGKTFRLPTEAEWEYAARGGKQSKRYKYAGSNTINIIAWYDKNTSLQGPSSPDYGTHVVATKQPNELGLYDLSGNVEEWCSDWYSGYINMTQADPSGPYSGFYRVSRGGSWQRNARFCRSSNRHQYSPNSRYSILGLRLVLSE